LGLYEFTHQNNRLQADGFSVTASPTLTCGSGLMQLKLGMQDPTTGGNNGNVWNISNLLNDNRSQVFDYDKLNRIASAREQAVTE